jgi:hypothetical protein
MSKCRWDHRTRRTTDNLTWGTYGIAGQEKRLKGITSTQGQAESHMDGRDRRMLTYAAELVIRMGEMSCISELDRSVVVDRDR